MKKTVLTAAFALTLFAGGLQAQDAAFTGKWNASADTPNGPMEIVFDLKAGAAGALSGSMAIPAMASQGMPEMQISDGKIMGKDVSFKVKITGTPNGDMVISYTGKLDGNNLTLNTKMDGAPDSPPMVAKRAGAAAPAKTPAAAAPAAPAKK